MKTNRRKANVSAVRKDAYESSQTVQRIEKLFDMINRAGNLCMEAVSIVSKIHTAAEADWEKKNAARAAYCDKCKRNSKNEAP